MSLLEQYYSCPPNFEVKVLEGSWKQVMDEIKYLTERWYFLIGPVQLAATRTEGGFEYKWYSATMIKKVIG